MNDELICGDVCSFETTRFPTIFERNLVISKKVSDLMSELKMNSLVERSVQILEEKKNELQ